jgi:hypothetical protein
VFKARVKETYAKGGVNLAYCCGGAKSAIEPFRDFVTNEGMNFEFTVECYGVSATLHDKSTAAQIGGTIVNMDNVNPIHPGGDQILHQIQDIETEKLPDQAHPGAIPDHSIAFLHAIHTPTICIVVCGRPWTPTRRPFQPFWTDKP